MKTRYLNVVLLAAASAGFGLAACTSGSPAADPNVEARLRNNLPSACTADQVKACPAQNVTACPDGKEPVIDYSADCCPHFTCQPLCQAAARTCPMTPAPVCPARTKLWIGTAIEDCCPAYRCEPDGSTCDPAAGDKCGVCDATNVACTLALPYCGPGIDPVIVGQTADCCPIYQCPCTVVTDPSTGVASTPNNCGCTTPTCKDGEQIVCDKTDVCGGPCRCEPARGTCTVDANCAADERCDKSACRLPPTPASANAPTCDPTKCGPQLGLPNTICADGTVAGPTGRCLLNADGSCGWEITSCPTDCFGVCVPNVQSGCKADTDCPTGQACEISCSGWGCTTGGTTTGGATGTPNDPSTGTSVPPTPVCACPTTDPSCKCDAAGNCSGQTCVGKCAPKTTTCDPNKPVACPAIAIACPDGATPISDGLDPTTCCPTYHCPTCVRSTTGPSATGTSNTACAAPACACAKQVATDPATCCPKYECGVPRADGTCG